MKKSLKGSIRLEGDKSLSHRAVIFASLAKGKSILQNLSNGLDVKSTIDIYSKLGVKVYQNEDSITIDSPGFHNLSSNQQELFCGNSGTTMRLSMGLLAGSNVSCVLTGDESLSKRPVKRVTHPLSIMGADICSLDGEDHLPVKIVGKKLKGIQYNSPIPSAQVKSAILLAGLCADGKTEISEPSLSRDHTERFLKFQGIDIEHTGTYIEMNPGKIPESFDYLIPGDISTAMFFIVGALLIPGSQLFIHNILLNETRIGALQFLQEMGANIRIENHDIINAEPIGDLVIKHSDLTGLDSKELSTVSFIDEIPILSIAAMFANGITKIHNVAELRVKETDRLAGIINMLSCFGCNAYAEGDDLIIEGGYQKKLKNPEHFGDHRLAMAIEICNLAMGNKLSEQYDDVISISAPEFYSLLEKLCD